MTKIKILTVSLLISLGLASTLSAADMMHDNMMSKKDMIFSKHYSFVTSDFTTN